MPTNNSINSQDPIQVSKGGLGVASTTAYGVLAGGTSSTSAIQNCGAGTSGQILKSNGASALPSFVAPSSVGGSMVLLHTITFDNTASSYNITPYLSSSYQTYKIIGTNIQGFAGGSNNIALRVSTDGGSTFATTGYSFIAGLWTLGPNTFGSFGGTDCILMGYLDLTSTSDYVSFEGLLTGYLASTGIQLTTDTSLKPTNKILTTFGNYIGTVNGLQILNLNAVNIVSGKVSIYGIVQ